MIEGSNEFEIIKYAESVLSSIKNKSGFVQIPVQYSDDFWSRFALVEFRPKKYIKVSSSGHQGIILPVGISFN